MIRAFLHTKTQSAVVLPWKQRARFPALTSSLLQLPRPCNNNQYWGHLSPVWNSNRSSCRCFSNAYRRGGGGDWNTDNDTYNKQLFDSYRSEGEWWKITNQLIIRSDTELGQLPASMFHDGEETVRWWNEQAAKNQRRNHLAAAEAVKAAFGILDRLTRELHHDPELLKDPDLSYWYSGNFPRAMRLITAILNQWCICWAESSSGSDTVDPPAEMLTTLEGLESLGIPINCKCYNYLMKAAVRRQGPDCQDPPVFCEELIQRMLERGLDGGQPDFLPDTVAFTTAIDAWAVSPLDNAAKQAVALWREMLRLYDDRILDAAPNTVLYEAVLKALANANNWQDMELAEEIFRGMFDSPYPEVLPSATALRRVIFGWCNLAETNFQSAPHSDTPTRSEALDRAFRLILHVIEMSSHLDHGAFSNDRQPLYDVTVCSKLISTAVRTSQHPSDYQRAEEMLQVLHSSTDTMMEQSPWSLKAMIILYSNTKRPREAQALLDELESQATAAGDLEALPKFGHYKDVMMCWIESRLPEALDHAEKILMRLLALTVRTGGTKFLPDRHTVEGLFKAMSRADMAPRTETLFRMIQRVYARTGFIELKPWPDLYLWVMKSWSLSSANDAVIRAEALLEEMETLYKDQNDITMRPTRHHFSAILTAYSKSTNPKSVERCSVFLQKARDEYDRGNIDAQPDGILYWAFLKVCSIAGDGETAESVFRSMIDDHERGNSSAEPTVGFLNMVLLSWSLSNDAAESLKRAQSVLEYVNRETSIQPDARTLELLQQIADNNNG